MRFKGIRQLINENPMLAWLGIMGVFIFIYLFFNMIIKLLPIIAIGIVALIGYKLYKAGHLG